MCVHACNINVCMCIDVCIWFDVCMCINVCICFDVCMCINVCMSISVKHKRERATNLANTGQKGGQRIRLFLAIIVKHVHVRVRDCSDSGQIASVVSWPENVEFVAYS